MASASRIRDRILLGSSDANIDFNDLIKLLIDLGFNERQKGSHHIFTQTGVDEIVNVQPKGNKAKPYQVKQIRNIILKYRLELSDE
jgi:predicted RNA binding protein YcfA (HicA-like mRNA interferase family)